MRLWCNAEQLQYPGRDAGFTGYGIGDPNAAFWRESGKLMRAEWNEGVCTHAGDDGGWIVNGREKQDNDLLL